MAARGDARSSDKSLPALVAVIGLIYNILFATVCSYLPDDPLYLGLSVSGYAWAGCALSLIGLVGIVGNWPSLITSFSHFLLVDTFVSLVCRLLVLQLFLDTFHDQEICNDEYASPWREELLSHDVVTSPHWQKHMFRPSNHTRRCRLALNAVQIALVALLVVMTIAQGTVAVAMRRYGKEVERVKTAVARGGDDDFDDDDDDDDDDDHYMDVDLDRKVKQQELLIEKV